MKTGIFMSMDTGRAARVCALPNLLGDAAVVGAEVRRAELGAPGASALAALQDTARSSVGGLDALDAVAAHAF